MALSTSPLRALLRVTLTVLATISLTGTVRAEPMLTIIGIHLTRQAVTSASANGWSEEAVLRQRDELTCGPAALATLLTYHFGEHSTEDEIAILAGTYTEMGTSMLGLRNACRAKGYEATGYRMTLPQLKAVVNDEGLPVIAHYREPLAHFAVVVAVDEDAVLVSDPASGCVTLPLDDFLRRWSGAVLVVRPKGFVDRERVARRRAAVAERRRSLRDASRQMGVIRP